jgi:hypothetical protein
VQVQNLHQVSFGRTGKQQQQQQQQQQVINQEVSAASLQQLCNINAGVHVSEQFHNIPKPAFCGSKSIVKCNFEEGTSFIEVQLILMYFYMRLGSLLHINVETSLQGR